MYRIVFNNTSSLEESFPEYFEDIFEMSMEHLECRDEDESYCDIVEGWFTLPRVKELCDKLLRKCHPSNLVIKIYKGKLVIDPKPVYELLAI